MLATLVATALLMRGGLGSTNKQATFQQMFSNNRAVNMLAAARLFLFGARDVWFVVGLPVFLYTVVGWSFWQVGGFMAIWVIGYGIVQASAPSFVRRRVERPGGEPDGKTATWLAFALAAFPAGMALALLANVTPTLVVVAGLIAFGAVFAMNSAAHSYLPSAPDTGILIACAPAGHYTCSVGVRHTRSTSCNARGTDAAPLSDRGASASRATSSGRTKGRVQ